MRRIKPTSTICFCAFLLGAPLFTAQSKQVDKSQARALAEWRKAFSEAKNAWRLKPTDLATEQDYVGPETRAKRDTYWDKKIGSDIPLTQPQRTGRGILGDSILEATPEIPLGSDTAWVVGEFESFRAFLSQSERSIYTEKRFRISSVIRQKNQAIKTGTHVDVGMFGGAVRTASGQEIIYLMQPSTESDEPGGVYLLELVPRPKEGFYGINRQWQVLDGRLAPVADIDRLRVRLGKSELVGRTVEEATALLLKRLPSQGSAQ